MTARPRLSRSEQDRFDRLLQDVLDALPPRIHALLDEVPVVVMDRPTPDMVKSLIRDGVLEPDADGSDLCGLHSGTALTHRSVEDPAGWGQFGDDAGGPEQIHLFRLGIIDLAGGFEAPDADEAVYEEIRTTLLHEIGHHFGLDEDDLDALGYA